MTERTAAWTIELSNLETRLRVGIWDHEREFQPVRASLSVRAGTSPTPHVIEDCLDYRTIYYWITEVWPARPHTPLLETKLRELMQFVFSSDPRIEWVDAALSKPLACREARGVGVRMAMSRDDYEKAFGHAAPTARRPAGP